MTITPKNAYDLKIPGSNDFLAESQIDLLSNFGQLYNAFARNHIPLDVATSSGNHTNVELLQQSRGPETSVGEISLYCKKVVNPTETTNNLFLRYQGGSAAGKEVQMTTYQLYNQQIIQPGQFGLFTYLPGGLILYFGIVDFSGTNSNTLYLNPFITKNVIAVNLCTSGPSPSISPWVSVLSERQGLITTLIGHDFVPGIFYYYIVLGNT
jgi:hypothetical protein